MGQNPTDGEVNDMINEVDVDGSGILDFGDFVSFFSRLMNSSDPENEVQEAYRRYFF
jgi:calmodulin